MKLTTSRIRKFQNFILSWWKLNKRDLPWRHTHDPYKILVSEVMLQQTTVSRVLSKYKEFLVEFPSLKALQKAPISDVLRAWKGMGYNRRALYLKKSTALGRIPETEKELMKLPGVGKYTARAILVFAYKQDIAAVDTNIRQIITHFFFRDIDQKPAVIQAVADKLVPVGKSWEWHQALMDYGALEMKSRATRLPARQEPRDLSKKTIPFKQTNRYVRGKIMDMLREGAVVEPQGFTLVVDGLVKDGLAVRKNGILSLPEG